MTINGDTYGLIDHCSFHAMKKDRLAQTIRVPGPRCRRTTANR